MSRKLYLVAYDVREPSRLRRALHILKDYAYAGQKSVFECWLNKSEKLALETRLDSELDSDIDCVLLSNLRKAHPVRTLGIASVPQDTPFLYLG